ncbi:MAG: hypothetical protein ACJ8FY_05755 [Gemmataceae bacterium]
MSTVLTREARPIPLAKLPYARCVVGLLVAWRTFFVIPLVVVLFLAGCQSSTPTTSPAKGDPPSITAIPNPVPGGTGKGTTKITWRTGNGSVGQVYVSADGKPEKLFATGSEGSKEAPWIRAGVNHEFRLYAGQEHKEMLASVSVTQSKQ